ncbi:hypothetical protein SAMN04487901_11484 [Prevotella communis]|uniref:Uncharacterized protein n=1 Tax=Prevotella communis TaxID=2913614 RepID=A0A1G7YWJ3_9BACT|nr:hypothetical protein [Prevotella communis]SDH00200.1 hypothetical protein SAMN04487901_11484 [Prevotella communis]
MKKIYMKPEMQTVVLQHQGHLMATSGDVQLLGGSNAEEFTLDPDGELEDDDVLR